MPIAPDLVVRPLEQDDAAALQAILNPLLSTAHYSQTMSVEMILAQILRRHPHTVFPTRLQHNQVLGVWRARQLVGCIDVAVGLDNETLGRPDYLPFGLLRNFVLPDRSDLVNEVAALMLEAAEDVLARGQGRSHQGLSPEHGLPILSSRCRSFAGRLGRTFSHSDRPWVSVG